MRDTRLVIFGSPGQGTPVMEAEPLSALDLPLKVLVCGMTTGELWSPITHPGALADRYHLAPALAENLAGIDPLTDALVPGLTG